MLGLDFETFSDVDIKTHGMYRYMESPLFTTLCGVISWPDGRRTTFDFVQHPHEVQYLKQVLAEQKTEKIVAHNAPFEIAVCQKLELDVPATRFIDSAVIARGVGAGSKLEAAAPQLLDMPKLEMGHDLIRLFSIPNKENGGKPFTWQQIIADATLYQKWLDFIEYCGMDAELSRNIGEEYWPDLIPQESRFVRLTQRMNDTGWYVDQQLVVEMQRRYQENLGSLLDDFHQRMGTDPKTFNVNSYTQLQKWCAARGVRAKSFDKDNVPKLIRQVQRRIDTTPPADPKLVGYYEVMALLELKRELGGSSLSKLQTILDQTSADGRLRGQYLHIGAGQSYRTSGRGVQMQNLPRLGKVLGDTNELFVGGPHWTNSQLSQNLRQCFMAEDPSGQLVVGDFSSVESRGLAYLAGEVWKLDAYGKGKDIYKMLATTYQSFGGVAYEDVTKEQRQAGKVGELACGYGAGAGAVQGFAEKMGIDMTEDEAATIVRDWRAGNSAVTRFWKELDTLLHRVMLGERTANLILPHGGEVILTETRTPKSLLAQHPGAKSIELAVIAPGGADWLTRVFHGCYYRGKDVCYYKPSELKGGDVWRARMTTPPHAWYKLYGGKLAGILTQSFCRELFFHSLENFARISRRATNVQLVGQFHDEIVVEWSPIDSVPPAQRYQAWSLDDVLAELNTAMSDPGPWRGFPLAADIKYAHRYIK